MHFEIAHTTTYRYNREVFPEPHVFRLRPRSDPAQSLEGFSIRVTPEPAGMAEGLDGWGNPVAWTWFSGMTEELEVVTEARVSTHRTNPFDYLPDAERRDLPVRYGDDASALVPYLAEGPSSAAAGLAQDVRDETGPNLLDFLRGVTDRLYEDIDVIIREEGDAWGPDETLERGEGSCRDLTVVYCAACRAQGVAARFVSGYQEGDPDQRDRYLHAWAEVYVPGGGWRGYDPTLGLAVADRHVALAAAADPAGAAPTAGTVRGTGATAEMDARIELRVTDG